MPTLFVLYLICVLLVLGIELTTSRHKWGSESELKASLAMIAFGPITLFLFVLLVMMAAFIPKPKI